MQNRWDCMLSWALNTLCNYRCDFCFYSKGDLCREHPDTGKHSPQYISKCFDDTGKVWRIHMSGGETFVYPRFVELCSTLTKKHCISINTNLTNSNVYDFIEVIRPERVIIINAGFHVVEREKSSNGKNRFVKKIQQLQDKGFNVRVEYVVFPPLLSRITKDVEYLKSRGVKSVNLKIFRGFYGGREYPQSYTDKERALISRYALDAHEEFILTNRVNFFGRRCSAGQEFFRMDVRGNLTRCGTSSKRYGNLFEGEYHFDQAPKPCPFQRCTCPYEGITLVKKGRYSQRSTFAEIRQEFLYRRERSDIRS